MTGRQSVAVIGAGPAGLMAAEVLARSDADVTVYDRMPTAGRKLLMAGRGGLNLTHSEPLPTLLSRYRPPDPRLLEAIEQFSPERLRAWCEALGEPTFAGSSGRIFPKSMKASPLLRAWLRRLAGQGVRFAVRHRWIGWGGSGALLFETPSGPHAVTPDATILALGGASWPQLGSDGAWVAPLVEVGVAIAPLRPTNCGVLVDWSQHFRDRFQGTPLHNVGIRLQNYVSRGEALVTRTGLEGGAIYALSAALRDAIATGEGAEITIDLRPDIEASELARRLAGRPARSSIATALRKTLKLAPVAVGLLHEASIARGVPLGSRDASDLAALIRAVPVRLSGLAPLARAISTAGGVEGGALDAGFMLRVKPGTFVAGEMLDWEAPTGGYLLQACFSMGVAAGRGALAWLESTARSV